MDQWHAVYDEATGELRSVGTVIANPLPEGLASVPLEAEPVGLVWDATTRTFGLPPPPDLSQLPIDTDVILHALGPALRIKLRAMTDPRVQDFAYCLSGMNTVLASEAAAALQLILALGAIDQAQHDALRAAIIPEG